MHVCTRGRDPSFKGNTADIEKTTKTIVEREQHDRSDTTGRRQHGTSLGDGTSVSSDSHSESTFPGFSPQDQTATKAEGNLMLPKVAESTTIHEGALQTFRKSWDTRSPGLLVKQVEVIG